MKTSALALQVQVQTWEKDSHGLFDYQATKLTKQYFNIKGPCKIFRNWGQATTMMISNDKIKKGQLPDDSYTFFSSIIMRHNGNNQNFLLSPPEQPSQNIAKKQGNVEDVGPVNTNAYLVVRYFKLSKIQGFPLNPGNIVKLGRVQYKIVEMGGLPKKLVTDKKKQFFLGDFNGNHNAVQRIQGTCKFCLCDDNTVDNFLISPCNCKGSCQFVHIQCLKMWIDSKVKKQVNGMVISYNFTKFECEICKFPFPRFVTRESFKMQMITIERPEKPYIIFEGIEKKESKEERCLHVMSPDSNSTNGIRIGRGHQCEIRLQDISVSRQHSEIKYFNGDFYITDSGSKFGTLVRLDRTIELNAKIKLQIGRSLVEFNTAIQ